MIVLTTIINLSLNCPLSIYITYGSYQSRQTAALMFFLYYALILSEKPFTSKHTLLFGDFHYISILTYHADLCNSGLSFHSNPPLPNRTAAGATIRIEQETR
jgi:hypothetical protein